MGMFDPTKPLEFAPDGNSYANPTKYSSFTRELIKAQFVMGGVTAYVYRYEGTHEQTRDAMGNLVDEHGSSEGSLDVGSFMGVQDPILGENRDRRYNFEEVPRLKGVYTVSDSALELMRIGFNSTETLTLEFHQATVEHELGRRFTVGDVIEFPHLREVGHDGRVANKWYQVTDQDWSPGGVDPTYTKHVIGVILKPLRHQQEFMDLMKNVEDEYGRTLEDQISQRDKILSLTAANQEMATEQVGVNWWDVTPLYFDPDNPDYLPYHYTGGQEPKNGEPLSKGTAFPGSANENDWFMRIDMNPVRIYQFKSNRWRLRQVDTQREWNDYSWVEKMREFMTDRSDVDNARGYDLVSVHDALTPRHDLSDPSYLKGGLDDETD